MKKTIFAAIMIASMFAVSCGFNEVIETPPTITNDSTVIITDTTQVVSKIDTCGE
jgi:hypothetical protein